MKQLGVDFGSILHKAGLPPVTLKKGESMMSIIITFERHYVEAEDLELNLQTHMFGGQVIGVVMESFRCYYHLVEEAASKMQQEVDNKKVSPENESVHTLGSPPELVEPAQKSMLSKEKQNKKTKKISKGSKVIKRKFGGDKLHKLFRGGVKHPAKNIKSSKNETRIPDIQTMQHQLDELGLTEEQKSFVMQANRRAHLSLKRKAAEAPPASYREMSSSKEDLVPDDSSSVVQIDISNETESRLLQGNTGGNSGQELLVGVNEEANSQCEIDNSKACEEDAWDVDLTSSQVKCVEKLEQSVVEPVVKKEPESDDDIQFIRAFIEGSYNGPRALVNSIKQE